MRAQLTRGGLGAAASSRISFAAPAGAYAWLQVPPSPVHAVTGRERNSTACCGDWEAMATPGPAIKAIQQT